MDEPKIDKHLLGTIPEIDAPSHFSKNVMKQVEHIAVQKTTPIHQPALLSKTTRYILFGGLLIFFLFSLFTDNSNSINAIEIGYLRKAFQQLLQVNLHIYALSFLAIFLLLAVEKVSVHFLRFKSSNYKG